MALVARDGSVDWLCWPRFDSDACFAALLGTEEQGAWRIAPEGEFTSTRSYRGDTLVLDTEFVAEGGRARLTDFMPLLQDGGALIRRLEGIEGELALYSVMRPRFGYGDVPPWWCPADQGWTGVVGPDRLTLRGPAAAIERDGDLLHTHIVLHAGETVTFVLQHSPSHMEAPAPLDPSAALAETENKWLRWIAAFDKATDWPHAVKRSLLTLKALTYQPTGGIVAAPTLGLPEKPAGAMNWDYRYGWLRDSTFTLTALLNAGFHGEARAWLHWLLRAIAGAPDKIRIMYRVDGGRRIDETELTHLPGWNGAKPVRLGNAAAGQRQLDVFGEVLDSALLADRAGIERDDWDRQIEESLVAHVECIWQQPDQGMWEYAARRSTTSIPRSWPGSPSTVCCAWMNGMAGFQRRDTKNWSSGVPRCMRRSARKASALAAAPSCSITAAPTSMRVCCCCRWLAFCRQPTRGWRQRSRPSRTC